MIVPVPPPADSHVHSECSWDAPYTSMTLACRRAVELGLPYIAFTDHADFTARLIAADMTPPDWQRVLASGGGAHSPTAGPVAVHPQHQACRGMFPGLRSRQSWAEPGHGHLAVRPTLLTGRCRAYAPRSVVRWTGSR
ncbi:PHP domain-containing protein [Dactylosporangium sp. NPDC051485]|uniref:PHP domain-containing protein n=1 Tax=Dactylosporangium sp. NPDC051485 TaxID=3154846 RepID=UPI0034187588